MSELPGAFTEWPAARTLFRDEDIVVVDKPWGLSTHPPQPRRRDDVV